MNSGNIEVALGEYKKWLGPRDYPLRGAFVIDPDLPEFGGDHEILKPSGRDLSCF
jgi:hypothetical protein